jgi:hypothetical protein
MEQKEKLEEKNEVLHSAWDFARGCAPS